MLDHQPWLRYLQPVVLLIVAILVAQVVPSRYANALVLFTLYAYISICWNFVGGLAGKLSLAHGAFFGLGAYISAVLFVDLGVPLLVGGVIAAAVVAIFAWIMSAIAFRRRIGALYFALLTLAFAYVLLELVRQYEIAYKLLGVHLPLVDDPLNLIFLNKFNSFYIGMVMVAIALAVWIWVSRHRFGYMLAAIREDEEAAKALGVNVPSVLTVTMVATAAATSFAGVLAAGYLLSVEANFVMSFEWMNIVLAVTLVGGLGRMYGPVVGAAFITIIGEIVRSLPQSIAAGGISTIVYGALVLLAATLLPSGIVGIARRDRELVVR
ncbi:amino acid/amide ABC transporter membrane protein 2, HAAT family [Pseudonocardia thermophila]|uniref:Amino acid/amide ABC transporter membrane protein 2, HAAT family n=1 Tax=Pseudonocardia thermophila TaxID=1848 RepID=A0A1M6U5P2_PSETH|nr:branched-chain amino acid ABC transporter permease [Pseudonocardia thermophila]SHK64408.1 amino acid/amide ABC transporter membrane protein 2, HAAT family [Pseudonocardia thermophila]